MCPPSPPSSAQATVLETGVASISWTAPEVAPEGSAYYSIKTNSSDPNDPIFIFRTVDMTQTSYTIATLNSNSEYYFTIEIENQSGSSPSTSTNTIKPAVPPTE